MPELISIYQNNPSNVSTMWESKPTSVSSANYLSFTVYCDQDYTLLIEWCVDEQFTLFDIDSVVVLAGTKYTLRSPVKAKYARFKVDNIGSTPNHLITQGFFILDG